MPSSSFNLDSNILLRAGAGAGKTTTLTHLFFRFAEEYRKREGRWPKIVITTFTRKATQEIKERLLKMALERNSTELFHYVSNRSNVHISTIHGILSVFLSRYGSEMGMSPDFQLLSKSDLGQIYRGFLREILNENPQWSELLEILDYRQLESALDSYYENGISFPNAPFANASLQGQMIQRTISDLGAQFKKVCTEILQQTKEKKYVDYFYPILTLDWDCQNGHLEQLIGAISDFFLNHRKPALTKAAYEIALDDEFKLLKKDLDNLMESSSIFSEKFLELHDRTCQIFSELAKVYRDRVLEHKISTGLISMADLELLSRYLLHQFPETGKKFSKEWDYWMIDEYQDTSPLQVDLLRHLVGNCNSFIVGDPQQSIYLFRGARTEVFHQKHIEITASEGQYHFRTDNWRSKPSLLGFLNFFFKKMDPLQFESMTTQKERLPDSHLAAEVILWPKSPDGQELLAIVEKIQELLTQTPSLPPEEICVLGRTNFGLEQLAATLEEYNIPYNLHNAGSFFDRREIQDALAFIKFLINPHDNLNFLTLLRSPWFYLPDSELTSFSLPNIPSFWQKFRTQGHPLALTLEDWKKRAQIFGLSEILVQFMLERGVFDTAQQLDSSGRREANLWKLATLLSQEERRPGFNFLKFIEESRKILNVDEDTSEGDAATVIAPRKVQLMTVHASKGLQFEHILLMGMNNMPGRTRNRLFTADETSGTWSLQLRDDESQSMVSSFFAKSIAKEVLYREDEESRRVLYVALTRAKSHITLFVPTDANKRSWADLLPINKEPGHHFDQHGDIQFSYLTRKATLKPSVWSRIQTQEDHREVRPPWTSPLETPDSQKSDLEKAYKTTESMLQSIQKTRFGIEIHSLLEQLKYFNFEELSTLLDPIQKNMLDFLFKSSEIPFKKILEFGFAEWGFNILLDNVPLQGRIDLWAHLPEEKQVWIIDYKTGSSRFSHLAEEQLRTYHTALLKMEKIPSDCKVLLAIIYTEEQLIKVVNF